MLLIKDFIQSDLTAFNSALKMFLTPIPIPRREVDSSDLSLRHFEKFCVRYKILPVSVTLNLKNIRDIKLATHWKWKILLFYCCFSTRKLLQKDMMWVSLLMSHLHPPGLTLFFLWAHPCFYEDTFLVYLWALMFLYFGNTNYKLVHPYLAILFPPSSLYFHFYFICVMQLS